MPKSIDGDCLDPGFGHENQDGYVRILNERRPSGKLVMRHRWFWELVHGTIPDGCEINHICKNRRCCNVQHLECVEGYHHTIMENYGRYKDVIEKGCRMLADGYSKDEVQLHTNRCRASIDSWIRKGLVNQYNRKEMYHGVERP